MAQINKGVLCSYQASLQHTLVICATAVRKIIVSQNSLLLNDFGRVVFVYDEIFLVCESHEQEITNSLAEKFSSIFF